MLKPDGTPNGGWTWADVPIGGGGYATGPNIHAASGRQFLGTDTAGAYVRDPTDAKWTTLFSTNTLQAGDFTNGTSTHRGCFAPSDKNRLYSHFSGYWFKIDIDPAKKLTDAGAITCTRWPTAMGSKNISSGAGYNRWWRCHPSVHPTLKDTVLLPTSNDGVYYSTDGLATVNSISIPACTSMPQITLDNMTTAAEVGHDQYMVWIDQGDTTQCYIFVQGIGLHRSTAGIAGPYSLITGSPLGATGLFGEADGTLWFCGDERTNVLSNPYMATDTTGWTAANSAALSRVTTSVTTTNYLKVLNGAASAGYAYQAFTTVAGYSYTVKCWTRTDGTAIGGVVNIGTSAGASDISTTTVGLGLNPQTTFVATGTTTYISLVAGSANSGDYTLFAQPLVAAVGIYQLARAGSSFAHKGIGLTGTGAYYPHHIAVDPFDNLGVLIWREQIGAYSINRGTGWTQTGFTIGVGGECAWRPKSAPQMGGICFDPTVQNRILCGEGFGSIVFSGYRSASLVALDYSKGQEQVIALGYYHNPSTHQNFVMCEDLPTTDLVSLTNYTNLPGSGTVEHSAVQYGTQVDAAIDDPTYMVGSFALSPGSYSTQKGAAGTWHTFAAALPSTANAHGYTGAGLQGAIAVSKSGNAVIAPSNGAYASYTKDGGATISPVLLNGSTDYCTNQAYFIHPRVVLTSDKTRPGVFAMVVNTNAPGAPSTFNDPLGGLWVTTPDGSGLGGDTWVQKFTGVIGHPGLSESQVASINQDGRQYYQCKIEYVPGFSQELLYTPYATTYGDDRLFWSQNDGVDWVTVGPTTGNIVRNVRHFAFGKALIGQTRPAVYFWGLVGGVTGNWATYDWFQTFYQVSNAYPNGYISDNGNAVGADLAVFGRMFCCITGKGSVYSTYSDTAHAT